MTLDADFLWSRLPAFYQARDAEQGGTLRALLEVMAGQGALLEADIARLYDNWFIETCEDWVVPYIGELLGVRGLYPVAGTDAFSQRALVANTLRLRRRKGTLAVLEDAAFASTGWRARAVEFFQLLETTQHMNHRRLHSVRTPDLRDGARLARIDGPFDRAAHSAELRPLAAGRYNIPNVGLYLWRLSAYALQRASARAEAAHPGLYRFDALGRDLPLFNRPRTETDVAHLAEPINVPEPLSRRVLRDELSALRQALADQADPPLAYFGATEGGPVLRIWLDGQEVPPEHLVVCNLSPLTAGAPPHDWRRPPPSVTIQASVPGLPDRTFPATPAQTLVGFDPVLGRIALPAGVTAGKVEVAYSYGFPGDLGGGPYDRRPVRREDDEAYGLLQDAGFDSVLRVGARPGDLPTLAAALALVSAGKRFLIRIDSDASETVAPVLDLKDTHLAIEATNGRRPVLEGDFELRGNDATRLTLSGIVLDGQLVLNGPLRTVDLRHCSLTPARGGIRHSAAGAEELQLILSHCVCGPIGAEHAIAGVSVAASVIDAPGQAAFDLLDTMLTLDRCTVFGRTEVDQLAASSCLFSAPLAVRRKQEGCVRFCYVAPQSETPRRYRCQPDLVMHGLPVAQAAHEAVRVSPSFTSTAFGNPGYAQLALSTAREIRSGAEDGAEMGAWNLLQQAQREANLNQALDEYLRFGLQAAAIFVN
jgi:hypothetical protein